MQQNPADNVQKIAPLLCMQLARQKKLPNGQTNVAGACRQVDVHKAGFSSSVRTRECNGPRLACSMHRRPASPWPEVRLVYGLTGGAEILAGPPGLRDCVAQLIFSGHQSIERRHASVADQSSLHVGLRPKQQVSECPMYMWH